MTSLVFVVALLLSTPAFATRGPQLSLEQKVDQIVSLFENSTPDIQYGYIAALGDGRGYTAGRSGFTTATGDLLQVVEHYGELKPTSPAWPRFKSLLPRLRRSTSSLDGLEALPETWRQAALDSVFLRAQDDVTEELYKAPARAWCRRLHLVTPLAYLVMFDSITQHGDGRDPDSLGSLISKVSSTAEKTFVTEFLKVRRADLLNPTNSETADEWRESVDRVDALLRLVDEGQWELKAPLRVRVWGQTYAL